MRQEAVWAWGVGRARFPILKFSYLRSLGPQRERGAEFEDEYDFRNERSIGTKG